MRIGLVLIFKVISTHNFCNSHAVISETCDRGYLIPQTDFWTAALTTPPRCFIQQGITKNSLLLTIFTIQVLPSPISVIEDISSHRPIFDLILPLPPFWWHQKMAALQKESRECIKEWVIYFFAHNFPHFIDIVVLNLKPWCSAARLFYVINQQF